MLLLIFFFPSINREDHKIFVIFSHGSSIFEGYMYVLMCIYVYLRMWLGHIPAVVISLDPWHQW